VFERDARWSRRSRAGVAGRRRGGDRTGRLPVQLQRHPGGARGALWSSSLLLVAEPQACPGAGGRRRHRRLRVVERRSPARRRRGAVDTPIEGLAIDSAFRTTLLENRADLDVDEARATVAAAKRSSAAIPIRRDRA
jgi:hypothetical protein